VTAGDNRALRQHLRRLLRQPDDLARALPGAFYTDPSWLAAEISELFAVQWVCLGRREEIPEPGDYFTAEVAGEPVIILRGEDSAPRALANVCRHRGTVLAEGAGRLRVEVTGEPPAPGPVSVEFRSGSGGATVGEDYGHR